MNRLSKGFIELLAREERGQAMVEFIIVFPLQLLFILGIMQLSLIYVGVLVTNHAAACAARAAIVSDVGGRNAEQEAHMAAAIVLSAVAGTDGGPSGGAPVPTIPGMGTLARFDAAWNKSRVTLDMTEGDPRVLARVTYDHQLIIPVVNRVFAAFHSGTWLGDGTLADANDATRERDGYPHVRLTEYCHIYRPWVAVQSGRGNRGSGPGGRPGGRPGGHP